ncbi:MAG: hypothetical protein AAGH60_10245 [Pseudomonadota bacterium]
MSGGELAFGCLAGRTHDESAEEAGALSEATFLFGPIDWKRFAGKVIGREFRLLSAFANDFQDRWCKER